MNKKGYITSFIFGLIGLFVLLLSAVALMGIQNGAETTDTITLLTQVQGNLTEQFTPNIEDQVVVRIVYSFAGFITYSSIEISKLAIEYGVANPDWVNPITLVWIVMLSLLAPIVIVLVKLLIIIFLLIKEYIQNKKEKKLLYER